MVIHARMQAPDWNEDEDIGLVARCSQLAPPTPDDDPFFYDAVEALPVCNGWAEDGSDACPIRARCLFWSLINNDKYGVWGGMTVPQRAWIRRHVSREYWRNEEYLRDVVPPADHFKDYGDAERDED